MMHGQRNIKLNRIYAVEGGMFHGAAGISILRRL